MSDETIQPSEKPHRHRFRRRSERGGEPEAELSRATERRPHRLRRAIGIPLALLGIALITMLVLLPSLVSTTAGTARLVRAIDERISGRLELDKLDVGWLSPARVEGVRIFGADGSLIFELKSLDTQASLLGLMFGNPPDVGTTRVAIGKVNYETYPDETTNLQHALTRRGEQPKPNLEPWPAFEMPFIGEVNLTLDSFRWTSRGAEPLSIRRLTGRAQLQRAPTSSEVEVRATAQSGRIASRLYGHAVGAINPNKRVLTITAPSVLRETGAATGGNSVLIAKDSRLGWGGEPSEASATVHYDLARLSRLAGPLWPRGLEMAGVHATKVEVRGTVADGVGLQRLRKLDVNPMTFTYDRIAWHGLVVPRGSLRVGLRNGVIPLDGAGTLPVGGGSLVLGGRLDISAPVPRYLCDSQCIGLRSVGLNGELAKGPLAFLPIAWGGGKGGSRSSVGAGAGAVDVSGTVSLGLSKADVPLSMKELGSRATLSGVVGGTNVRAQSPFFSMLADSVGPLKELNVLSTEAGGSFEVPFELAQGKIRYDGLTLNAGQATLRFSGSVGVVGERPLDMLVGLVMPKLKQSEAIPIKVGGTVSAPRIEPVPADVLRSVVKSLAPTQRLDEASQELLEKLVPPH